MARIDPMMSVGLGVGVVGVWFWSVMQVHTECDRDFLS